MKSTIIGSENDTINMVSTTVGSHNKHGEYNSRVRE